LRSLGWRVLRVWEHDLDSPQGRSKILAKLSGVLGKRMKQIN
jgi:hypothetical protein